MSNDRQSVQVISQASAPAVLIPPDVADRPARTGISADSQESVLSADSTGQTKPTVNPVTA